MEQNYKNIKFMIAPNIGLQREITLFRNEKSLGNLK